MPDKVRGSVTIEFDCVKIADSWDFMDAIEEFAAESASVQITKVEKDTGA